MAALATVDDVESRWRPLTTEEQQRALVLLDDASAVIRTRFPSIDTQIAYGDVAQEAVIATAVAMVVRVMSNPEGVSQETIDSYSVTYRERSGSMYLDPTEADLLSPDTATAAFSIRPTFEAPS